MASQTYFASREAEETAEVLLQKSNTWYNQLENNRYLDKLRRMWMAYYGVQNRSVGDGHKITFGGEQGELASLSINHFHSLAKTTLNMITANRPAMQARATNTDYKSTVQTQLANGLLDYYLREKRLEVYLTKAVEISIIFGAGYIKMEWDPTSGETYDVNPETGIEEYEGDIKFTNLTPFDVIFDASKESSRDHDWILCRTWKNRFDLAAKYPELEDEILAIPTKTDEYKYRFYMMNKDETDDVAVYEFYHRRKESMKQGRYMLFLEKNIVLVDQPLPYQDNPIYRMSAGDILGTSYGYTSLFDMLPIQEAIDSLYSTVVTNNSTFGVQNIWVPTGSNITVQSLSGGLNVIESNPQYGPPQPIQLTNSSPETYKLIEILERVAETITGINSVARGNPPPQLESGTALALIQSMALQYISGLQQSYVQLIEDVGTGMINTLKMFASVPRVAAIVGLKNRSEMKQFTGDDLQYINRVIVDMGNPLSRTTAGRVEMAQQMLQMSMIKTPEEYFQVLNTGKLENMTDGITKELNLIKLENEELLNGNAVTAILIDDHVMHIKEHKCVLDDPELRKNPMVLQNTLAHINEHIHLMQTTDPNLLGVLGIQALAPPGGTPISPDTTAAQAPPASAQGASGPMQELQQLPNIPTAKIPNPPGQFRNSPVLPQDLVQQ